MICSLLFVFIVSATAFVTQPIHHHHFFNSATWIATSLRHRGELWYNRSSPFEIPHFRMSHLKITNENQIENENNLSGEDEKNDLAAKLSKHQQRDPIPNDNIFFIELGFGNDSHGQSATKASIRACRNAIEFNSIPSIQRLLSDCGGYDALKLDVLLAIPSKYQTDELDFDKVVDVFPYGDVRLDVQDGGMVTKSGIAIDRFGDVNDDMVVVCASVIVGH